MGPKADTQIQLFVLAATERSTGIGTKTIMAEQMHVELERMLGRKCFSVISSSLDYWSWSAGHPQRAENITQLHPHMGVAHEAS